MRVLIALTCLMLAASLSSSQKADTGEFVLTESKEQEYTESIVNRFKLPAKSLTEEDARDLAEQMKSGKFDSLADERVDGDVTEVPKDEEVIGQTDFSLANKYISSYQEVQLKFKPLGCCPRAQSYDCRTYDLVKWPHVVFKWPYGWCYPLQPVIRKFCNCNRCFRLCTDCVYEGSCKGLYQYKKYPAACWGFWHWRFIILSTYVQSGCYCSAKGSTC